MSRSGRLAGLVLAGGASTRFGSDKALAEVDGRSLLAQAVWCLRAACDGRVLVASGDGTSRPGVADGQVADVGGAGGGPLAAIAAGLLALRDEAEAVAVLAVDHVRPSPDLMRLLADRRGGADCALVAVGGWWQPLHAVWGTAAADDVAAAVRAGGAGPLAWLAGRDEVVVLASEDLEEAGIDPGALRDADHPGALASRDAREGTQQMVDDDREIERKFLVVGDDWRRQSDEGERIVQGYLHVGPDAEVRVRVRAGEAVLTVKRGGASLDRHEVEVPLSLPAAEELLAEGVVGRVVRKRRHLVPVGEDGLTAEIDVFEDDLEGLVVAEVELPDTSTAVPELPWLGEDVTGEERYYNATLATSDDPLSGC